jgi:DNA-binding CsgD family transcriptional regulator/tetratricopeptide (TPR) repeat protein
MTALSQALAGGPAVVLIEGEGGIGKSTLLREYLSSRGDGRRALVGRCPPFRQPHTLGPVADALRQATDRVARLPLSALCGALRSLFPEWADDLPPAPEPAEDPTAARHRLFRALTELAGCLQVRLLAVEDVQWADEATIEFLLFLATQQRLPVSLVVTYRQEEVSAESLLVRLLSRRHAGAAQLRLAVGPLDVAGTARMVSTMLGVEQVPAGFAEFMHERTDGVPLAVEELVRLLGDRADLARRDGMWVRRHLDKIDVPSTIRDAVLERTGRLTGDTQAILRAAAVLAYPADEGTLLAVSGLPAARRGAALDGALRCRMLAEDTRGHLSFRHVLASRAVYEAIPVPERRMMHLRAGRALEMQDLPPTVRLARHFYQAGETGTWRRHAEQAADLAIASGDVATAFELLHSLLTDAKLTPSAVIRLTEKIPTPTATGDPRFQEVVQVLRSALAAGVPDPAQEAELRFHLGRVLNLMEEFDTACEELERAIPHLSHKPVFACRAMVSLGWARGPGTASAHLHWLRRAAEVFVPAGPNRLSMTIQRATALLLLGESAGWAEAAQVPPDAATAQEKSEITRGNLNVGHMAMLWGRYGEAQRRLARALDLASRHQYWRYHALALESQAHLEWYTGAWHGLAERVAALAQSEDLPAVSRLGPLLVTAQLNAASGAHAEAREILQLLCEQTSQSGMEPECMEPAAALARLLLADGDPGAALIVTDWPVAVLVSKETWLWATDLAPARITALAGTGQLDQAAELTRMFARGLRGREAPAPRASLLLCQAILARAHGHHDRAEALFARAAVAWDALPRPYEALLARERQAECLLAGGQADAALTLLSEVRQKLAVLGATADAERVAQSLHEHKTVAPRGRRGYGDQLSPREIEVVQMVIAGHTNREIAEALSRSEHTVATQRKSAMRKLRVSSRAALAVAAKSAGISAGGHMLRQG